MTDSTWGLMPKSQVDPETIEEAIARLISVHEADPTAHLGEGEALQAHRDNGVIDHRAGSVLADKKTMTELDFSDDFSVLTKWNKTGEVNNSNWPSAELYVEYGAVNKSELLSITEIPAPFLSFAFASMFQLCVLFSLSNSSFKAWWGMGMGSADTPEGYGFSLVNGVLKAVIAVGGNYTWSATLSLDVNVAHIYRAQLMPLESVVRFYIDGSLVATLAIPTTSPDSDGGPDIGISVSAENDGNMLVSDLHFSRSVV